MRNIRLGRSRGGDKKERKKEKEPSSRGSRRVTKMRKKLGKTEIHAEQSFLRNVV